MASIQEVGLQEPVREEEAGGLRRLTPGLRGKEPAGEVIIPTGSWAAATPCAQHHRLALVSVRPDVASSCRPRAMQIDVLEVEGEIYGFSGCHRYEAHQRLGLPTIRCRVRKATREVLKMHMM